MHTGHRDRSGADHGTGRTKVTGSFCRASQPNFTVGTSLTLQMQRLLFTSPCSITCFRNSRSLQTITTATFEFIDRMFTVEQVLRLSSSRYNFASLALPASFGLGARSFLQLLYLVTTWSSELLSCIPGYREFKYLFKTGLA